MADFSVSTILKGRDQLSKSFNSSSRAAVLFGEKSSKAFKKASRSGLEFKSVFKGILAAGAVQKGLGAVTAGVRSAVSEFIQFDDAIVAAGARFKDMIIGSKEYNKQLQAIKKSARAAAQTSPFSPAETAKGLDFLAKAGFKSTVAMGILTSQINLALATGEDFATATDKSSDLLGAFGLATENVAQKIKNVNRLNDVLAKTSNSTNVTLEDMFETMKTIGPIASGIFKGGVEEVAALTGVLGNSGIKGTVAMTALKSAYLNLVKPVGAAKKFLDAHNISIDDGTGKARRITDVMEDLGGALSKVGSVEQGRVLKEIFGKIGIAGAKNLVDNIKNIKTLNKELNNAAGFNQKVADVMKRSLGNQVKSLQSALFELTFKGFTAFEREGKSSIETLTKAINEFDVKPIIDGLKTTVNVISQIFQFANALLPVLKPIAAFWVTYRTLLITTAAAQWAMNAAALVMASTAFVQTLGNIAVGYRTVTVSIFSLKGAMIALNVIMTANPIGLIIVGVVALGAAVFAVIKYWDEIIEGISKAVDIAAQFFGFSDGGTVEVVAKKGGQAPNAHRVAPNTAEVEARRSEFQGTLQIAGAPEGSTLKTKNTGAPQVRVEMMGAN